MSPDVRHELQRLLSSLCDGMLTPEQQVRLEELLEAEAECRQVYLEYVDLHARLLLHPGLPEASPALPARRRGRAGQMLRYAAVALIGMAASWLVQALWLQPPAERKSETPARTYVATLTQALNCAWDDAGEARRAGARLCAGELRLREGLAQIHFDSGADLVIEGPATLRLDSAAAATVQRGKVVFRGNETGAAFDVHTPAARLEDVGTEYAVVVGPEGEEVHVFDGEVRRLPRSAGSGAEQLRAGEARRYGTAPNSPGTPTPLDRDKFTRELAEPADRAAGLLAYEGFDYADANAFNAGAAGGGFGWLGPWRQGFIRPLLPGDQNQLVLNPRAGLVRPGAAVPAVGGAVDYTGFTKFYRRLMTPLRLDTDGVYYLSFLFRRAGPPADPLNAVAVLLWPAAEYAKEQNAVSADPRQRLNVGVGGPNELFTHLQGNGARTPLPLHYGETYLLVAKIVAGRSDPDQVFMRVYAAGEPIERQESGNWSVVGPAFQSDFVFDWLQVHVNSMTRQAIDEIRLGTTWVSVTSPWSSAPAPR